MKPKERAASSLIRWTGWFGGLCLSCAIVALVVLNRLQANWLSDVAHRRCYDLPPLPPAELFALGAAALAAVAVINLMVWCASIGANGAGWKVAVATILVVVAVVTCLWALLISGTSSSNPRDGVDGSGAPCRSYY